jgi:hypothetical protein
MVDCQIGVNHRETTMNDAEIRTDAEIRGLVLKHLYELHSKSEWVDWDNFHELGLPQQEVGRYLKQLHELGLAEGKFVTSDENEEFADIRVRIRARGADAVENPERRPSEVIIDQSIHIHDQQNVTFDIGKLNAAIDGSPATLDEKTEAKSLLRSLNGNKLLAGVLQKWFSGHLAS